MQSLRCMKAVLCELNTLRECGSMGRTTKMGYNHNRRASVRPGCLTFVQGRDVADEESHDDAPYDVNKVEDASRMSCG